MHSNVLSFGLKIWIFFQKQSMQSLLNKTSKMLTDKKQMAKVLNPYFGPCHQVEQTCQTRDVT